MSLKESYQKKQEEKGLSLTWNDVLKLLKLSPEEIKELGLYEESSRDLFVLMTEECVKEYGKNDPELKELVKESYRYLRQFL